MNSEKIFFSIDPFQVSYRGKTLPSRHDGTPIAITDYSPEENVYWILRCVPRITSGEVCDFFFNEDPHSLIFIPWGGEVTIIFRTSLTEDLVNGQHLTIPTTELLSALLMSTQAFIDEIQNGNETSDGRDVGELIQYQDLAKKLIQSHGYLSDTGQTDD